MADFNADDRRWLTIHAWWQGMLPDVCRPTIAEWTWEKLLSHDAVSTFSFEGVRAWERDLSAFRPRFREPAWIR